MSAELSSFFRKNERKHRHFAGRQVINMKVKTFLIYLPSLDIAFNQEKLQNLQKELDDIVGYKKSSIVLYSTPCNEVTSFTVVLWALGRTEAENREIIDKATAYFQEKDVPTYEAENYLMWDEEKIFIEIEAGSKRDVK